MKKFEINGKSQNSKASERYVDVTFFYEHNFQWQLSVPIEYRRTGINIEQEDEIKSYIKEVYDLCNPKNWEKWRREQLILWKDKQKREVCRKCYQTGERGTPFGIEFWYEGNRQWDQNISTTGKEAEKGCIGCGWYDFEKWRKALNEKLNIAFFIVPSKIKLSGKLCNLAISLAEITLLRCG